MLVDYFLAYIKKIVNKIKKFKKNYAYTKQVF
jgi:hypothetical protein